MFTTRMFVLVKRYFLKTVSTYILYMIVWLKNTVCYVLMYDFYFTETATGLPFF